MTTVADVICNTVCACSLNGPSWLPMEFSLICSQHFLELKSADDPSFIPGIFPVESADFVSSEFQVSDKPVASDCTVLQKVVDKLPVLSTVDAGRDGPAHGRVNTSQLQDAFRELVCHICQLLVAHDSELMIEGTVGVTVDGGARVVLLHFADQLRKTEASDVEHAASAHPAKSDICPDVENTVEDRTVNKVLTRTHSSQQKISLVDNAECSVKFPTTTDRLSHCSMSLLNPVSDLAHLPASTNSSPQSNAVGMSAHKRKAELGNGSVPDKPKQQTLLRELLCAPLPPKRQCRPVNTASSAITTSIISDVIRQRRPAANSSVLGGLLQTGNYQRELNVSPVGGDIRPKHNPGNVIQGGHSGQKLDADVHSTEFGGNAVRALLKLASEHAASGRHDMLRNNKHQRNDRFTGDRSATASHDRRCSLLYQNFVSPSTSNISSECSSASQNVTKSNSSSTVCSSSSESALLTMKQEVSDPGYE